MTEFTIIRDGREKDGHGYHFDSWPVEVISKNLSDIGSEGDYSVEGFEDQFAVERKSLDDLASCVGTKRDGHFEPQVQRAVERLSEYAIVVEAPRWEIERGNYFSQVHPNSILGTIEAWSKPDYYNVDFYLCDDDYRAEVRTYSLLSKWQDRAKRGQL
jgi:ERCC4-type nuclease